MSKTKTYEYSRVFNCKLETKPTPRKGLSVYRVTTEEVHNSKKYTSEGFFYDKDFDQFQTREIPPMTHKFALVNNKYLQELARYGYSGKNNDYKFKGKRSSKPFSDLDKKNFTLIHDEFDSHMVFDINDKALPVGVFFDYIDAHMNNGNYNLKKAHKHLSKRKDIHELSDITEVEWYNRDDECKEYIHFLWEPPVSAYRKMWKRCLELSDKFPSCQMHQAIFELDLLGLRKVGAALFDSFYGDCG